MKKKKQNRFPDYDRVEMEGVVSFGTTLFIRKDKRAIKIVFPAGEIATFMPEEEIATFMPEEEIKLSTG